MPELSVYLYQCGLHDMIADICAKFKVPVTEVTKELERAYTENATPALNTTRERVSALRDMALEDGLTEESAMYNQGLQASEHIKRLVGMYKSDLEDAT